MPNVRVEWINNNDRISPRKQIVPTYPPEALARRVQDVVIVEFTVIEDGSVADPRIVRSVPPLDDAAIDALQHWEFAPTNECGIPVRERQTIAMRFAITGRAGDDDQKPS